MLQEIKEVLSHLMYQKMQHEELTVSSENSLINEIYERIKLKS